jgi:hypothetical protein
MVSCDETSDALLSLCGLSVMKLVNLFSAMLVILICWYAMVMSCHM